MNIKNLIIIFAISTFTQHLFSGLNTNPKMAESSNPERQAQSQSTHVVNKKKSTRAKRYKKYQIEAQEDCLSIDKLMIELADSTDLINNQKNSIKALQKAKSRLNINYAIITSSLCLSYLISNQKVKNFIGDKVVQTRKFIANKFTK